MRFGRVEDKGDDGSYGSDDDVFVVARVGESLGHVTIGWHMFGSASSDGEAGEERQEFVAGGIVGVGKDRYSAITRTDGGHRTGGISSFGHKVRVEWSRAGFE